MTEWPIPSPAAKPAPCWVELYVARVQASRRYLESCGLPVHRGEVGGITAWRVSGFTGGTFSNDELVELARQYGWEEVDAD